MGNPYSYNVWTMCPWLTSPWNWYIFSLRDTTSNLWTMAAPKWLYAVQNTIWKQTWIETAGEIIVKFVTKRYLQNPLFFWFSLSWVSYEHVYTNSPIWPLTNNTPQQIQLRNWGVWLTSEPLRQGQPFQQRTRFLLPMCLLLRGSTSVVQSDVILQITTNWLLVGSLSGTCRKCTNCPWI